MNCKHLIVISYLDYNYPLIDDWVMICVNFILMDHGETVNYFLILPGKKGITHRQSIKNCIITP